MRNNFELVDVDSFNFGRLENKIQLNCCSLDANDRCSTQGFNFEYMISHEG